VASGGDSTFGRREFLLGGGGLLLLPGSLSSAVPEASAAPPNLRTWAGVRAEFGLAPGKPNFAAWLLASHPRPVREAIERHRRGLDVDAKRYLEVNEGPFEEGARDAAARYLGIQAEDVALTDSTTMGLGLVYGGVRLRPGQEVVTSEHDFYATHEALRLRAERSGALVRKIRLFSRTDKATVDEILSAIRPALTPRSRVLALTWVHSATGMKLPVRAIARLVREANADRAADERVLFCLDGVHGLGVENVTLTELGCDVFVAGCHKWLFGPRGTGIVWATPSAWSRIDATIPTFDGASYGAWLRGDVPPSTPPGPRMTPGGFHSFEHRWALAEAFQFQLDIGKGRVERRTHTLARRLKQGLSARRNVAVVTPMSEELSAGVVCLSPRNRSPRELVDLLWSRHGIVASVTPYSTSYLRLGPSIVNSRAEVDKVVEAIAKLT